MKRGYFTFVFVFITLMSLAQTEAISYQAVILNPDSQQIPGFDSEGTVLANTDVTLRFTVINDDNFQEYRELHRVTTDAFGMVNVFIGEGESTTNQRFNQIYWAGDPKSLLVEIDFYNLGEYVQLSTEKFTYTPQAFHRDIIATGDMEVNGNAIFKDDFVIQGETIINNDLDVGGNIDIDGTMNVEGVTTLGDDLTVDGVTNLNRELMVNNGSTTTLSGELNVGNQTRINGGIEVANEATIGGDTSIDGNTTITGDGAFGGAVVIDRRLQVGLSTTLNNDLFVAGRSDLGGATNIGGNATVDGDVSATGAGVFGDDLTATGRTLLGSSLDVLGKTTVDANFTVNGRTNLNDDLKVDGGATQLTGTLSVDGKTDINNSLNVNNSSPTVLGGTLNVVKNAVFDDDVLIDGMLTVNGNLGLSTLTISGEGTAEGDHIALFENTGGVGADGIAIRINNSQLNAQNRFISFFGEGSYLAGRIESFDGTSQLEGLPTGSNPISQNQGIVYGSKGADYAEWLEKEDPLDDFQVGEVVGVKGGKISRNTKDADHILTISFAPIVLGNMPDEHKQDSFEKVGFMGQVPALVKGTVKNGDYIVASGMNDGYAKAISPKKITLNELKNVIGKAWSASEGNGIHLINVSVGLKSNEWVRILELQEERLESLEKKLETLESLTERLQKMESKVDALDMN
ncbi:MAG: hypothetical protein AAFP76_13920 [Bacteroidota bacterium]